MGADPIFLAVGRALSRWTLVEDNLMIFIASTSSIPFPQILTLYQLIRQTKSRVQLLGSIVESKLPANSDEALLCHKLFRMIDGFAERRNEIAHGRVDKIGKSYFFTPIFSNVKQHIFSKRDGSVTPTFRYNADQIEELASCFLDLSAETNAIRDFIYADAAGINVETNLSQHLQPWKRSLQTRYLQLAAAQAQLPPPG